MIRKSLKIAIAALQKNKMRTGLAMLGMTIGVAAVLTMFALGTGAQENVSSEVKSAGTTLLFVRAGNFTKGGEEAKIASGLGSASTLTNEDAAAIKDVAGVAHASSVVRIRSWVNHGDDKQFTQIYGVDVEYPKMFDWSFENGKFFKSSSVEDAENVAVIGNALRDQLFPDANPVGETIEIHGVPFKIKGWFTSSDDDQAAMAVVPYTALEKITKVNFLNEVTVSAEQAGDASQIAKDIVPLLRQRHNPRQAEGRALGWNGSRRIAGRQCGWRNAR